MLFASSVLLGLAIASAPLVSATRAVRTCKTIPADSAWPSTSKWSALNQTVDGRLIKTVPLALPCYQTSFDSQACDDVRSNWHLPEYHEPSSSSIMCAPFSNRSCDPFSPDLGCTNKYYVEYSVNVTKTSHIVQALKFAKKQNIRFVVKNTGHDYMGKSTGHGALAVWTHYLTDTQWITNYTSKGYTGPAVKAHAGVTMKQMYTEASAHGYALVGGDCPTVGMAGGFIQGGGLGALSGTTGLAADNTLEFEVVTVNGDFITASPTQNSDLFWALSGGGGGTYGIVWSVTVKVQPDQSWSTGTLQFVTSNTTQYHQALAAYRTWTANLTDTSVNGYALAVYFTGFFMLAPAMAPNISLAAFSAIYNPLLAELDAIGLTYNSSQQAFPGFFQAYTALFPEFGGTFDVQNTVGGGRFMPRKLWDSAEALAPLNEVIKNIVDDGATGYEISIRPSAAAAGHSATLPQWRTMQGQLGILVPWNDTGTQAQVQEQLSKVTNVYMPAMKAVTPGAGAYLNEADPFDPEWKETFYGVNYNKLLAIKKKWDPEHVLYGSTSVGGDFWEVQPDGRLCSA